MGNMFGILGMKKEEPIMPIQNRDEQMVNIGIWGSKHRDFCSGLIYVNIHIYIRTVLFLGMFMVNFPHVSGVEYFLGDIGWYWM